METREKAIEFLKTICEDGRYYTGICAERGDVYRGEVSINLSSIYTLLIQDAGRFVEAYASDLMYGIRDVDKKINNFESGVVYFGMREDGVDHLDFVAGALANRDMAKYRRLYAVVISADDTYNTILVSLRRLIPSTVAYKFKNSFAT